MPFAIALLTAGILLAVSGLKGVSILELLNGEGDELNPKSSAWDNLKADSEAWTSGAESSGAGVASTAENTGAAVIAGTSAGRVPSTFSGTPQSLINQYVLPLARKHNMRLGANQAQVAVANAAHGPTVSGGKSDHQGPPSFSWATDMSNGTSPTKEMDALAQDLANAFGIPWNGSGLVSKNFGRFKLQLIYRCGGPCAPGTSCGGNHCNHVHFGARVL